MHQVTLEALKYGLFSILGIIATPLHQHLMFVETRAPPPRQMQSSNKILLRIVEFPVMS